MIKFNSSPEPTIGVEIELHHFYSTEERDIHTISLMIAILSYWSHLAHFRNIMFEHIFNARF